MATPWAQAEQDAGRNRARQARTPDAYFPAGGATGLLREAVCTSSGPLSRRQRSADANPLAVVKRASKRHDHERILRRYPDEIDQLLRHAPGVFEEAFWLCGGHAGLRLPGEALGLRWGAVDFHTGVMRPYDNWVRNEMDTTKTSDSEAIPMTPRLTRALAQLKHRSYATGDQDFVFASELTWDSPVSERPLRDAFKVAAREAGLKSIKMYNLRHSFGTTLARNGVDIRTVQALMRHDRLSTTEQYMAYSPRPADLRIRLPGRSIRIVLPECTAEPDGAGYDDIFERLEEDIPTKWLEAVRRVYVDAAV